MKREDTVEDFCDKAFQFNFDVVWFQRQGVYRLDDLRVVKITLSDDGGVMPNTFNRLSVELFNKNTGLIDHKLFPFKAYLPADRENRADEDERTVDFVVDGRGAWKWLIAVPKSTRSLTNAIETYLTLWR